MAMICAILFFMFLLNMKKKPIFTSFCETTLARTIASLSTREQLGAHIRAHAHLCCVAHREKTSSLKYFGKEEKVFPSFFAIYLRPLGKVNISLKEESVEEL